MNHLLYTLEEELRSGKKKTEYEKLYQKYYEVTETAVRGKKILPKQEDIAAAEKDYGYFSLLSKGIKDPVGALKVYRMKDMIEKAH